jgi:hypothetical protein
MPFNHRCDKPCRRFPSAVPATAGRSDTSCAFPAERCNFVSVRVDPGVNGAAAARLSEPVASSLGFYTLCEINDRDGILGSTICGTPVEIRYPASSFKP